MPFGGGFFNGCIELQSRYKNSHLVIGENTAINNNAFIACANSIVISDNCLIGRNLSMSDFEAHNTNPLLRNNLGMIGNIYIGKNVWIGNNVTILKNSEIGENSIIAAGTVVSRKFTKNVIIGGVPAKIIKQI